MTLSRVFTMDDTTVYSTWSEEEGGIVILFLPGIGEVRMTLAKSKAVSQDLARDAEYGEWALMEKRHEERNDRL